MEPETRRAVSTYLQTFILIAVASGASVFLYSSLGGYSASLQGVSISISNASVRQGSALAFETVQVANTGTVSISSFTLATPGISSTASYGVSLENIASGSSSSSSGTGPASIPLTVTIAPGQSELVTVTIYAGNVFTIGTGYSLYVVASGASAQQAVSAVPS